MRVSFSDYTGKKSTKTDFQVMKIEIQHVQDIKSNNKYKFNYNS